VALALFRKTPWVHTEVPSPSLEVEEVYRLHAEDVARWTMRVGGPSIDVEDVVQEVFLQVHRALPSFRGESGLKTWLYRITQNVVYHRRRKDRWRSWTSQPAEELEAELPSDAPSPLQDAERQEARERVYRVLDGMSEKYRTLLILFELEELSGEEISELTGIKLATIWVRLHRARRDFVRRLEALNQEERE